MVIIINNLGVITGSYSACLKEPNIHMEVKRTRISKIKKKGRIE
jgi:hypothetical protein